MRLLLLVIGAIPSMGRAQPGGETDPEALIRRGLELRRQSRDIEALALFRGAHELQPTPRSVAQIGLAEQALGRWLEADEHLRRALGAANDRWIVEHRAPLEESLRFVAEHIGELEVLGPDGAEVLVDGRPVATLPMRAPARVVSGTFALEVRVAGGGRVLRDVSVPAGGRARETVDLTAAASAPLPRADEKPASTPAAPPLTRAPAALLPPTHGPLDDPAARRAMALRIAAWSTLVGAGLALALGVGANVIRERSASVWNDDTRCQLGGRSRLENCGGELDRIHLAEGLLVAGYVAAAALAVTSTLLFVYSGRKRPTERAAWRPSCGPGPGLGGIACGVDF